MKLDFQVRYFLEHKALPQALWNNREQLLLSLLRENQKAMMEFYKRAETANPLYQCHYTPEQFSMSYREYIKQKRSVFIMRIGMPAPEQSPLCRAVYFCFVGDGCEDAYFTSELTPDGQYFICAWTKDDVHLNYGKEPVEDFDRVAELFWLMHEDGGSTKYKSIMFKEGNCGNE